MTSYVSGADVVLIMKGHLAWGVVRSDSYSTQWGWVDPIHAHCYDPLHTKRPTDVTYAGSPYEKELRTGKVVRAMRILTIKVGGLA